MLLQDDLCMVIEGQPDRAFRNERNMYNIQTNIFVWVFR
ncbi:predicted protein [Aspergillus nidulans FGSC A4]|uniref:Uncharacterized protein n=1 Tax=Emericella nidulans (strain FGSC A4 / ATCC 38163 / CBS 112.46 / NRRL 194 / M139) TaxID=227321 RepID=Q5AYU1_EMENI|nr:hypothetical protein [Aspergillus nidulans FGSC A4]EAA57879.1 predicted protein [Aspergillus nidulans FGSC A4]CBF70943.1 TPA: conserved hypothetical protein [Aspergillus nidulans FGSC A4]|eukprot:XP_664143.1 predicted protein [Aspergillus nidulans FGSC A4]